MATGRSCGLNEMTLVRSSPARIAFFLLALCYAVMLGFVYTDFISPMFAYQGMRSQDVPARLAVTQVLLAMMPVAFLSTRLTKPSEFQVLLLYVIVYVPSIMVGFHICNSARWGGYTLYMFTLGVSLIALSQVRNLPPLRIPRFRFSVSGLYLLLFAFSIATYAGLLAFYGLPDNLFDFQAIYSSRAEFKERALEVPSIVNYLFWWQGVVVNPLFTIIGMLHRRPAIFVLGVVLELLLFTFTTLRGMILSIAFCIFVVLFIRSRIRAKGLSFLALVTAGMAISALLMADEGVVGFGTRIFVQRWLAIQGQITGAFYDFFSTAPNAHFGDSFLSGLVSYQYGDLTSGEVVGDLYVSYGNRPIANATGNFWADAFGQLGYLGVFGATVVAFILLWIVDSVFRRYRPGMGIILFSTCALSMTEQALQAMLLTGGLVPLLLIGMSAEHYFNHGLHAEKAHSPLDVRS